MSHGEPLGKLVRRDGQLAIVGGRLARAMAAHDFSTRGTPEERAAHNLEIFALWKPLRDRANRLLDV